MANEARKHLTVPAHRGARPDTARGTAVNLAARLCVQAAGGEVLLSPRALRAAEDTIETERAGELILKRIQAPVSVVRILGLKN